MAAVLDLEIRPDPQAMRPSHRVFSAQGLGIAGDIWAWRTRRQSMQAHQEAEFDQHRGEQKEVPLFIDCLILKGLCGFCIKCDQHCSKVCERWEVEAGTPPGPSPSSWWVPHFKSKAADLHLH